MTQECIDSIFDKTQGIEYEVILVDNGSKDGSKEHFEKLDAEGKLRYIYSFENMGFGRANNVGMMQAKGEYCLLLNSDTRFMNNACRFFYDYEKEHNGNLVLGSWLMDANLKPNKSYGDFPTISSSLYTAFNVYLSRIPCLNNLISTANIASSGVLSVDYIMGADIFLPRAIFELTNGFDEDFFMYYEETEWQYRMHQQNIPRFIIDTPKIIHFDGGSQVANKSRNIPRQVRLYTGLFTYIKKRYNYFQYILFRILFFIIRFIPICCTNLSLTDKKKYVAVLLKKI